jgi:hypothetical protein
MTAWRQPSFSRPAPFGLCVLSAWAVPGAAQPAAAPPWADEVLYFAIVDRLADGDPGNIVNVNVDRSARGAFHGGDLKGLRAQPHDIADLGVTALWITPLVKNIDGFVTGAGARRLGVSRLLGWRLHTSGRRFGAEADLAALA